MSTMHAPGTWNGPAALTSVPVLSGRLVDALNPDRWSSIATLLGFSQMVAKELGPHVLADVVKAAERRTLPAWACLGCRDEERRTGAGWLAAPCVAHAGVDQ